MKTKNEMRRNLVELEVNNATNPIEQNSSRRTNFFLQNIILFLSIFALLFIYSCTSENQKYSFEQIGYYKSDSRFRVFTFYIKTQEKINKDSIPEDMWSAIREHGKNQMHTEGTQTQSFYYLSKENTPDVTLLKSYKSAINTAYNQKPLAVVSIDITGVNFVKKPEE